MLKQVNQSLETLKEHETDYVIDQKIINLINSAKGFSIYFPSKNNISTKQKSLNKIFRMVSISMYDTYQFIGLTLISYTDVSEEEGFLTTTMQSKIDLLNKSKKTRDLDEKFKVNLFTDKAIKLPRNELEYVDNIFESVDYLCLFKLDPQEMTQLFEAKLINGNLALLKKNEFLNKLVIHGVVNRYSTDKIVMNDHKGKRIELRISDNLNYCNDKRNWLLLADSDGEEAIVNSKIFKSEFEETTNDIIVIKDYMWNIRKIKRKKEEDIQKTPELSLKKTEVPNVTEPESGVETVENKEILDIIEENEITEVEPLQKEQIKPKLKSAKSPKISIDDVIEIKDTTGQSCSIPLNLINSYIYQLYLNQEELPSKESIKDIKGNQMTISPYDVAIGYLSQFYLNDIYPNETKCVKVLNINNQHTHLLPEEQYNEIKETENMTDISIVTDVEGKQIATTINKQDDSNKDQWVKAIDINGKDCYMKCDSLLNKISNQINTKTAHDFIDYSDRKITVLVSYFLAHLFVKKFPKIFRPYEEEEEKLRKKNKDKIIYLNGDIMTIYTDIKDIQRKIHIVKADAISSKFDKEAKLIDEFHSLFEPDLNYIEYFNKDNELHQLYRLNNEIKARIYIPKPHLVSILDDIIATKKVTPIIKVNDYRLVKQSIPLENILKFLSLSSYYNQLTESMPLKTNKKKNINGLTNRNEALDNDNDKKILLQNLQDLLSQPFDGSKMDAKLNKLNKQIESMQVIPRKYQSTHAFKWYPYTFVNNDTNSYYEVPNLIKQERYMMSKGDILSRIESQNNRMPCSKDTLIAIIDENNNNYEFIQIKDISQNKFYTKKVFLLHYVNMLINNESIPQYVTIEDQTNELYKIDLHKILLENFRITPSPFLKDEILKNPDNTLYEAKGNIYKFPDKETYQRPEVDLFEFMEIEDIHDNKIIVRKPFVRSLLYKENPLINVPVEDSANQVRVIAPIAVIGPKIPIVKLDKADLPKELELIDYLEVCIEVKDINNNTHLISKKVFDEFYELLQSGKLNKEEVFSIVDRKKKIFKSTIYKMIPKSKKIRQWTIVNDVNGEKCLVYRHMLNKLISSNRLSKDEITIYDINNKQRKINPWQIREKLKEKNK